MPLWPQYDHCLTMALRYVCTRAKLHLEQFNLFICKSEMCQVQQELIFSSGCDRCAVSGPDVLTCRKSWGTGGAPAGAEPEPTAGPRPQLSSLQEPVLQTHTGSAAPIALQRWLMIKFPWPAKERRLMCSLSVRDHRRVEVRRGLCNSAGQTPCWSRAPQSSLCRTRPRWLLGISSCKHQARQMPFCTDSFPESCVCAWDQECLTCSYTGVSGPSRSRDNTAAYLSISHTTQRGATKSSSNTTRQLLCTAEVWGLWGWSIFGNTGRQSSSWIWRWYFAKGSGQFACF